jgi:hypothetical protein
MISTQWRDKNDLGNEKQQVAQVQRLLMSDDIGCTVTECRRRRARRAKQVIKKKP